MRELLTDRSVIASVAVALVLVAAVAPLQAVRRLVAVVPAWLVWGPAAAAGFVASEVELDDYRGRVDDVVPWTFVVMAAGAAIAIAAALIVGLQRNGARAPTSGGGLPASSASGADAAAPTDRVAGIDLGVALAAATIGVFACVPETGLLRILPGPVAIAATAAAIRLLRPFGVVDAAVLSALLGALSLLDGQSRPASIVGAAACLAGVALIALPRRSGGPGGAPAAAGAFPDGGAISIGRLLTPAIAVVAILACSRIAGTRQAVALAAPLSAAILFAAAFAIRGMPSRWVSPGDQA